MRSKCDECGRFLAHVVATILSIGPGDSDQTIQSVNGVCKKHGLVETSDWYYEQFFPDRVQESFPGIERGPR